jgi:hypothetical protein
LTNDAGNGTERSVKESDLEISLVGHDGFLYLFKSLCPLKLLKFYTPALFNSVEVVSDTNKCYIFEGNSNNNHSKMKTVQRLNPIFKVSGD